MPSNLGNSLVDALVPVVDSLRSSLASLMGHRQYEVHIVRRTWSGGRRGSGTATITSDVTMTPPPAVSFESADGLHWEMTPGGRDQVGKVRLTEVSLGYTEADLTGGTVAAADDFYFELRDSKGQGLVTRRYVPDGPPVADPEQTIGWKIVLRKAEMP